MSVHCKNWFFQYKEKTYFCYFPFLFNCSKKLGVKIIDPSQGAWLTGNLTNHNAESAILSNKQTRQEYIMMFIHVYFVF